MLVFMSLSGSRGTPFSDMFWKVQAFSSKLGASDFEPLYYVFAVFLDSGTSPETLKNEKNAVWIFFSMLKDTLPFFCFSDFGVICGVLFGPGDGPKEKT